MESGGCHFTWIIRSRYHDHGLLRLHDLLHFEIGEEIHADNYTGSNAICAHHQLGGSHRFRVEPLPRSKSNLAVAKTLKNTTTIIFLLLARGAIDALAQPPAPEDLTTIEKPKSPPSARAASVGPLPSQRQPTHIEDSEVIFPHRTILSACPHMGIPPWNADADKPDAVREAANETTTG